MSLDPRILIGLAALAFVLAVVASRMAANLFGISAEAFSRASNNLALLVIAWLMAEKHSAKD